MTTIEIPVADRTPRGTRPPRPGGRALNVIVWGLQIGLAVIMVLAPLPKLTGDYAAVTEFNKIGAPDWFRYFTGGLEIAGGLALLVPRLAGYAAILLAVIMVGAIVAHLTVMTPAVFALVPAVMMVLFGVIARYRLSHSRRRTAQPGL